MNCSLSTLVFVALSAACAGLAQDSASPVTSAVTRLERTIQELYEPCSNCGGAAKVALTGAQLELPNAWTIDVQSASGHGGGLSSLRVTVSGSGGFAERLTWDEGPAIGLLPTHPSARAARRAASSADIHDVVRAVRSLPRVEVRPAACRAEVLADGSRLSCGGWSTTGDFYVLVRVSGLDGSVIFEADFAGYPSGSAQPGYLPLLAVAKIIREAIAEERRWRPLPEQELRNTHFVSAFSSNREILTTEFHGWVLARSLDALAVFGHSGALPTLRELEQSEGRSPATLAKLRALREDPARWLSGAPKLLELR